MKIDCIVGARPNLIKIAPLLKEMEKRAVDYNLIHTGQHYDRNMNDTFFQDLQIPKPDINLGVGSGTHAAQTARIMMGFEEQVLSSMPDLVLVVGDVNSTLAAALVAAKLNIPVAHVEAGYRSFDRKMPEEINRVMVDHISEYLFAPTPDAVQNLVDEGIDSENIYFVGNIMAETLLSNLLRIKSQRTFERFKVDHKEYALATIHRPENVDDKSKLSEIIKAFAEAPLPVILPLHPRTKKCLEQEPEISAKLNGNVIICEPLAYLEMMNLLDNAAVAVTDSGGLQEEACLLGVPCVTVRNNTERVATISIGANQLVSADKANIIRAIKNQVINIYQPWAVLNKWDDQVSQRIMNVLSGP